MGKGGRGAALVVALGVLGWGAASVEAGPARVVTPRLEVLKLPVNGASVVAELIEGTPVCVVEEASYQGPLHRREGWLAVLAGGEVGYAPTGAVVALVDERAAAICAQRQAAVGAAMTAAASAGGASGAGQGAGGAASGGVASGGVASGGSGSAGGVAGANRDGTRPQLLEETGSLLPRPPGRFALSMGTGLASLQKGAAERHRIGDTGLTLNFGIGLIVGDVFAVSATLGAAFPSDNASFRQDVVPVDGGGDPESAESELSLYSGSISAGLRTPFLVLGARSSSGSRGLAGALFADFGAADVGGGRSISNCIDCREDDLELSGGSFWRAGFDLVWTSSTSTRLAGLSASYQRFLSGDLLDDFRLAFSYWM